MISDEMAYRQYLDGQEQAADLLVERYGDPLVYYLHGYLKDLHEAEDLMIEAFAQIFAKALSYPQDRQLQGVPLQDCPQPGAAPQTEAPHPLSAPGGAAF